MDREAFDRVVGAMHRTDGLRVRSVIVSGPHGTFRHDAGADAPTDLRSVSKLVVALAVGAAIDRGVALRGRPLSLDLPVEPFFPGHLPGVRLRHLLTNTAGFDEGFLFRTDLVGHDLDTLVEHVLARELVHPPGTHFAYTNAGWYLISAMITDALGVGLRDFVTEHLLGPLGITDVGWVAYGRYDAGCTGLSLSATDLHTVGRLFAVGGRGIVPPEWLEAVRSPVVPARTDDAFGACAYGYGMWIRDADVAYGAGTGGQFVVVDRRTGTVVTVVTETGNTRSVARCLRGAI